MDRFSSLFKKNLTCIAPIECRMENSPKADARKARTTVALIIVEAQEYVSI